MTMMMASEAKLADVEQSLVSGEDKPHKLDAGNFLSATPPIPSILFVGPVPSLMFSALGRLSRRALFLPLFPVLIFKRPVFEVIVWRFIPLSLFLFAASRSVRPSGLRN